MIVKRIAPRAKGRTIRIAAYCRVSTLGESQEGSLESQAAFFQEYIKARPRLVLAGIYADKKSGTTGKRPGFLHLLEDARAGKIDRVVCKSLSRFSRNVVDALEYCEVLGNMGINVRFLREDLDTARRSTALILRLMAALAQNESLSISKNVRTSNRRRFLEGRYNPGNQTCFGYRARDGRLLPDGNAPAVRLIFSLFLSGAGYGQICQKLREMGIKNRQGRDMTREGIRYILQNEAYIGDKALLKHQRKSLFDHRITGENAIYLKNDHPAIVERKVWEQVQEKLAARKRKK